MGKEQRRAVRVQQRTRGAAENELLQTRVPEGAGDEDVRAVKMAGYDDAQVIEIMQHVALNTWTNYINSVAQTEIDFPVAQALAA